MCPDLKRPCREILELRLCLGTWSSCPPAREWRGREREREREREETSRKSAIHAGFRSSGHKSNVHNFLRSSGDTVQLQNVCLENGRNHHGTFWRGHKDRGTTTTKKKTRHFTCRSDRARPSTWYASSEGPSPPRSV